MVRFLQENEDKATHAEQVNDLSREETKEQVEVYKADIKARIKSWVFCFIIACIPVICVPIICNIFNKNVDNCWIKAASSAEIIYIGIVLLITALYDYNDHRKKQHKFPWGYITLLIIGMLLYTAISTASELSDDFNVTFVIVLNLSFLAIVLFRGIAQYISMCKEAK